MIRKILTLSLGLAAATLARANTACTSLADSASGAGLTGLLGALTAATTVLEESAEGQALLAATGVSVPLPAARRVTVFAPTNAAFNAVVEASGGDVPPAILANVLLNHVVMGALPSDTILDVLGDAADGTTTIPTLLGGNLVVSTDDGAIFVKSGGIEAPGASVETQDVETCVGVVHVIDTVLLPTAASEEPTPTPEMAPGQGAAPECNTLAATATDADLTGLLDAVAAATPVLEESEEGQALLAAVGASDNLPLAERITVFAPTNTAFEAVIEASGGSVPPALLADVLLNHVVLSPLRSDGLLAALDASDDGTAAANTLLGDDLIVTTAAGSIFVKSGALEAPGAEVVAADFVTCVGIVHVVDTVLLPGEGAEGPAAEVMGPAMGPEAACSSISDTASEADLAGLLGAITLAAPSLPEAVVAAVGATDAVPAGSRVTVFAPTDAAFAAAAEEFGGELPDDEDVIASVLLNHIVPAELTAAAIVEALGEGGGSVVVQSLLESDLFVTTVGEGLFLQSRGLEASGAEVVVPDVETCAGVVHVINAVLLPTKPDGSQVMFDMTPMEAPGPAPGMEGPDIAPEMGPAAGPAEACVAASVVATEANLTALVDAITFAAPSLNASVVSAITANTLVSSEVTIFAPTDGAFAAAAEAFGGELPTDEDVIASVLLNHIIQGALSSGVIIELLGEAGGSIIVQSLLNSDIFVSTVGDGLFLQTPGLAAPGAEVVVADVGTCAGIVHIIDTVLLPTKPDGSAVQLPAVAPAPAAAPAPAPGPVAGMAPDTVSPSPAADAPGPAGDCAPLGVAATEADLTTLASLLTAYETELSATEAGSAVLAAVASTDTAAPADRVTVFAPSNAAFDSASAAFGGELPADTVPDVLLNHVVPGDLTAAALTAALGEGGGSTEVETLSGGTLFVTNTDAGLYIQSAGLESPGALVVTRDVITCPGPVHVIDTVLLPQSPEGATAALGVMPDGAETQTRGGMDLPPADEAGGTPAVEAGDDTAAAVGVGGPAGWLGMAVAVACLVAVAL